MKTLLSFVLLSATAFGSPQMLSIHMTDESPNDCPVTLSGLAVAKDEPSKPLRYSFTTTIYATNNSQKSILLVVIKIAFTGTGRFDISDTRDDDYFFASDTFNSRDTKKLEDFLGPMGAPQAKVENYSLDPKASAEVAFVQFGDGSTWGDLVVGEHILRNRAPTWNALRSLAETYRTNGKQQFLRELREPSQLQTIRYLQNLYESNGNDASAVIKKLDNMLEYADLHGRALQSQRVH
jgi:hypothetical protein